VLAAVVLDGDGDVLVVAVAACDDLVGPVTRFIGSR
jgi:hypothetical protein